MELDRDRRTLVAVEPGAAMAARPRLFAALEQAFPVRFAAAETVRGGAEATLEVGAAGAPAPAEDPVATVLPRLAIGDSPRSGATPGKVLFGPCQAVDRRLRGIAVPDPLDGPDLGAPQSSEEVLATTRSTPIWVRSRGPVAADRVGSSLPELAPTQTLAELLAARPLALAALTQFLRGIVDDGSFARPAPRAAILFDDPNLRWRTYGFIDYQRLLEHTDAHGYHAAMAMIPLDGRHQHRATVDLFRRRADRLSLVFHGNNHLAQELMQPGGDGGAIALAAQALRRAMRFESRYGLRMDRVMTPPHGMCSESSTRALGALGYDALCAIHPLPWTERIPAERPLAGWDPAEFAGGCAVIPRIHLSTPFHQIALRAFLGHPLVLYGHHDDLATGLDLLEETVTQVNGLGSVEWSSLGEIAASNRATRLEGDLLRVRPYSHRLRVDVPTGAGRLLVEPPRGLDHGFAGWSTATSSTIPFGQSLEHRTGGAEIRLRPLVEIDPESVPSPTPSVWPIIRRAATESRDRLRPLLSASPT